MFFMTTLYNTIIYIYIYIFIFILDAVYIPHSTPLLLIVGMLRDRHRIGQQVALAQVLGSAEKPQDFTKSMATAGGFSHEKWWFSHEKWWFSHEKWSFSIVVLMEIIYIYIYWLVVDLPLWKMMEWKSVEMMIIPIYIYYGKINSCSKAPTRWEFQDPMEVR